MSEYGNPHQDEQGGRYENAPFIKGLEYKFHPYSNLGVSNEILINAKAQGLVVRAADLDMHYEHTYAEGVERATPEKDAEHIRRAEADAAKAKTVYDELATKYRINIPKFMYVVGEARYLTGTDWSDPDSVTYITRSRPGMVDETKVREEGDTEPMLYTVAEKVVGDPLHLMDNIAERPTSEDYINLYSTMVRYIVDKFLNHEPFFSDFGGQVRMDEQFMFGHIENQDNTPDSEYANKIWLVDVDPKVYDPTEKNNEHVRQSLLGRMLYGIAAELQDLKSQLGADYPALDASVREQMQRLSDRYPEVTEMFLKKIPEEQK